MPKRNYKAKTKRTRKPQTFNPPWQFFSKSSAKVFVTVFAVAGAAWLWSTYAASFNYLANHPNAERQSTVTGRVIKSLKAWNGKLYSGYGDWTANSGPIRIVPFNPISKVFEPLVHTVETEAIQRWFVFKGKLYALAIDRRKLADYAVATKAVDGTITWVDKNPVGSTHVFEMNTLNGTDLWMAGSKSYKAALWRSTDGGETWAVAQLVPARTDPTNNPARFYFMAVLNGKLYAQVTDWTGGPHPTSLVFDGTSWSQGPNIIGSASWPHKPEVFRGKVLFKTWGGDSASTLMSFDGNISTPVLTPVYDHTVSGEFLYVLRGDGTVSRSRDLISWQTIGTAPATARTLEVLNNEVYIGTADSKIYAADLSEVPSDIQAPTVQITNPVGGATVSGTVTIQANASDDVGLTQVDFYAGSNLINSDTSSPYSVSWDTNGYANGSYALKAIAYDAAGNAGNSSNVNVTLKNNVVADTSPPVVTITKPSAGSGVGGNAIIVSGSTVIEGYATDNVAVARMEVWVDGALIARSKSGTIRTRWGTRRVESGSHTIEVRAYDQAGNVGSSQITVTK